MRLRPESIGSLVRRRPGSPSLASALFPVLLGWSFALLFLAPPPVAFAQNASSQTGRQPDLDRPSSKRVVPPPPVAFDAGIDLRARQESLHNLLDFHYDPQQPVGDLNIRSDAHYYRVRHRIWAQLKLRSGPRLYSRFTTEWRKYLVPYLTPKKTEVILDNFYIDIPHLPGVPLSVRIGRQDLVRGEGFVLLEGGPLDGSRSIYMNAAVIGFDGANIGLPKMRFELLGIRNPAWDEFILANGWTEEQQARNQGRIVENDETAAGLYITRESLGKQRLEGYYIYKEEEAPSEADPYLRLHTVGARATGALPYEIEYAAEGALQFGHDDSLSVGMRAREHRSYGAHAWIKRSVRFLIQPTVKLGGIYLSGDDPDDDASDPVDESWNPLFSRWPMWSDLVLYSLSAETGRVGYWSNLSAVTAGGDLRIGTRVLLSYNYYHFMAPHAHPAGGPDSFFGTGTTRGDNHQWKLAVTMNPWISWHFLVESFSPGDFYGPQENGYFLRWELMVTK